MNEKELLLQVELQHKFGFKFYDVVFKLAKAGLLEDVISLVNDVSEQKHIKDYFLNLANTGLVRYSKDDQAKSEIYKNEISEGLDDNGEGLENKIHENVWSDASDNPHDFEFIKIDDWDKINSNLNEVKSALIKYVSNAGGVKKVSDKTINELRPFSMQALSRFLNSKSPARKKTILNLAEILGIHHICIYVGTDRSINKKGGEKKLNKGKK